MVPARHRGVPHEAAPIDPEAQPTAVGGTSQKAEAIRTAAVFGPPFLVERHRGLWKASGDSASRESCQMRSTKKSGKFCASL
jgi:hypothetical protein